MEIPYDKISAEALRGLISEFVSRDGTDYGHVEATLESKIDDVMLQLKSGKAVVTYDQETETCNIIARAF